MKNDKNTALDSSGDSFSKANKHIKLLENNSLGNYGENIDLHIQVLFWTMYICNFIQFALLKDSLTEIDGYIALSEDSSKNRFQRFFGICGYLNCIIVSNLNTIIRKLIQPRNTNSQNIMEYRRSYGNKDKDAKNKLKKAKKIWDVYRDIFFVLVFLIVLYNIVIWWITTQKENKYIPTGELQPPRSGVSKVPDKKKIKLLMSFDEISKKAEVITARVIMSNNEKVYSGSGIIIKKSNLRSSTHKNKDKYYLVTVSHIWREFPKDESMLKVILSDKKEYQAQLCESQTVSSVIGDYDLQIICFESEREYEIAIISQDSELSSWDDVYIFGYPCMEKDCSKGKFVRGNIGLTDLLPNSLTLSRGYSVPYTNETDNGMSGSPVLNFSGELVAIHGLGKNAESPTGEQVNSPYLLSDKTFLDLRSKKTAKYFSWGISSVKIKSLIEKLP